ncbi:MAG: ATP-dependent DNA helicase DinG [Burkholderiales bacterium]|nr:ATP-dependent DNA helicase DinG [Burkholderiales bacterium]
MSFSAPQHAPLPVDALESPEQTPAHARTQGIDADLLKKARKRLKFLYRQVAKNWPGFLARPGQDEMMQAALLTFLCAKSPDDESRQGNNLAQLEAGTGTGKTVAYCLAAIVASELLEKTVIVSTATVALQEQLFHKDLPRLAQIIPDLHFDIIKGRGRYVCESRLEGAIHEGAQASLLGDEFQDAFVGARTRSKGPRDSVQAMRWFNESIKKLRAGKWDGDIDSLEQQPDPEDWRQVQANAHACNGGQCEYFKSCAFFRARRRAASATIQVANHALILATLQTDSTMIDPGNTLFVFDEAHHLPGIAADQFSYRARYGATLHLLTSLRAVASRHGRAMPASRRPDPVAFGQAITDCTDKLAILERYWTQTQCVSADQRVHRFTQGRIPDALVAECEQLGMVIRSISGVVSSIAAALMEIDESKSLAERDEQTRAGVELGVYLSQLNTLERLFAAWATHDPVPWAKWMEFADPIPGIPAVSTTDAWLCASPMTPAQLLSRGLWKSVSAAVCTSATLTACGSFDFFDRLSGMNRFPERRSLVVASPFDYATQGELRIAPMRHSPKSPEFSEELCEVLPGLLREHHHGQLVLFTSKRQMQACHAALPKDLSGQVQMQGDRSRTELLKEHSRCVASGQRSIIFGLQSFGEGIDLPGQLCEHVVIDKLPFSPPTSPVEEALAEWLTAQGRDPFAELSVPRTAMKLAQWAGRGVRTVTDRAVITVCDTRLVTMRYGKDILAGLPPFPVVRSVRAEQH